MTDHSELKRLADACPPPGTYHYQSKEWAALMEFQAAVEDVYGSDVGMAKALIAEIESLREHKQSLVDLRESHGYESWASVLVMVDKLKAENEALRKDAERYHWLRGKVGVDFIFGEYAPWLPGGQEGMSEIEKQTTDEAIDADMSKGDKP